MAHGIWPSLWHAWQTTAAGIATLAGMTGIGAYLLSRREMRLKVRQDARAEASAYDAEWQRDVDTARNFTATALSLLEPLRAAAADAESRLHAVQTRVAELEHAVETLTGALAQATASARAERGQLEQRLAGVTAERDKALTQLAEITAERNRLRDEMKALADPAAREEPVQ